MKTTLTIGLIQSSVGTNPRANVKKTIRLVRQAAEKGAKVVCLQELFQTKYFPTDEKNDARHLAESVSGETTNALAKLARELEVVIVVPIFEVAEGRYFNSAVVIDADGSQLGSYRKIHIPHDPFFYEQSYFEPGNLGYRVFDTRYLKFAVLICYDQWFPEAARAVALLGADLIFYPTAIGYLQNDPLPYSDWLSAWVTIQRSHAIANFVHVAAVNRVGTEGPVTFWGSSFVCDAFGKVIKKGGSGEQVVLAAIDVSQNARLREGWRFTKNRRPDTYVSLIDPVRQDTPLEQGLKMPAEWEPHDSTWLAWPEDPITFPRRLPKVREQYLQIIEALTSGETVNLAVKDAATGAGILKLLKKRGVPARRVQCHVWDYADVWFRDYGPIFVVNRERRRSAIVQWRFNSWGGKYSTLLKDGNIPYFISERLGLPLFRPGIVLEGGAIEVNGKGTLMTTEQCLLNPNRNPDLSRDDMETYLRDYLGATRVIWLKSGISGDDTDGHIDNVARFVGPSTVLCAVEQDRDDDNYQVLKANYDILQSSRDQDGLPLQVIPLPMPPPVFATVRGERLRISGSYANFYIGNSVVLVPTFSCASDELAVRVIRSVFPEREVVGIDCRDLIYGAGALHCISQQQPLP